MKQRAATCLMMTLCGTISTHAVAAPTADEIRERCRQVGVPEAAVHVGANGQCTVGLTGRDVRDISFLKGLAVTNLFLWETSVTNINVLRDMPLTALVLYGADVDDLSPLEGMNLTLFALAPSHRPSHTNALDLAPLRGMPIRHLRLPPQCIHNIEALTGMPLEGELDLRGAPVSDISPLRGMQLTKLDIRDTKVEDLAPLKGMPLQELEIENAPVTNISPVAQLPLTRLNLYGTRITDLSPLSKMALTEIWIAHRVTDLSPLRGLPLKTVYLPSPYRIRNGLDVLRDMPSLKGIGEEPGCITSSEIYWIRYDAKLKIFDAPHRHGTRKAIIEQWLKEDQNE